VPPALPDAPLGRTAMPVRRKRRQADSPPGPACRRRPAPRPAPPATPPPARPAIPRQSPGTYICQNGGPPAPLPRAPTLTASGAGRLPPPRAPRNPPATGPRAPRHPSRVPNPLAFRRPASLAAVRRAH